MATPMTPERFQDRWEAFKGEPQQVSGIWGLYSSISEKPAAPQPARGNPLALPFFDQLNNGPQGWRHCQSSSIAMNLAFLKCIQDILTRLFAACGG
jgi:hypothetical protein